LFGMGPKLVTHTETKIQPKVRENRVAREYLEIRRRKERGMSRFVFVSQHHDNVHIKKDKMDGADFVHGTEEKFIEGCDGNT